MLVDTLTFFVIVPVHLFENAAVKQATFNRCFEVISLLLRLVINLDGAGWRDG